MQIYRYLGDIPRFMGSGPFSKSKELFLFQWKFGDLVKP